MEFGTEGFDGWVVSGGVHPVGEKNHFEFPNGIDPDAGAGKSQMAERLIPASPHLTKKTPKKESNLLQKGKEAG